MSDTSEVILVNGETYIKASTKPKGSRAVVVVDRGWIFAGDVTEENGRIYLDNAVWVFRWKSVGFAMVIDDPSVAELRKMTQRVDIPSASEVYRVPVPETWGLGV